jgi:hypothetical protein
MLLSILYALICLLPDIVLVEHAERDARDPASGGFGRDERPQIVELGLAHAVPPEPLGPLRRPA